MFPYRSFASTAFIALLRCVNSCVHQTTSHLIQHKFCWSPPRRVHGSLCAIPRIVTDSFLPREIFLFVRLLVFYALAAWSFSFFFQATPCAATILLPTPLTALGHIRSILRAVPLFSQTLISLTLPCSSFLLLHFCNKVSLRGRKSASDEEHECRCVFDGPLPKRGRSVGA